MDEGERMKRKLTVWTLLAALGGGMVPAAHGGKFMAQAWNSPTDGARWGASYAYEVPNVVGAHGVPVAQRALANEPTGADYAHAMLSKQFPGQILSQAGVSPYPGLVLPASFQGQAGGGIQQTNGTGGPAPGISPTMAGAPGIAPPGPPGAVAALGSGVGPNTANYGVFRTEVRFVGPAGMKISWFAPKADGKPGFTTQYLEAPARYNFLQNSVYRLKLSEVPNRPGVDLYPTLEVVPCSPKTATFLAHSAVPISFTEEDFEQVAAGNFVVKVIYLPDPQFQDLAATGPDEVVSSRLEPGVDPILEAKRRGTILAIVRLGNIDLEAPNTPAMDAPDPKLVQQIQMMYQQQMAAMQAQAAAMRNAQQPNMTGAMPPGMMRPGMMPPNMMGPGMMPPAGMMMPPPGLGTKPPAPTTGTPTSAPIGMQDKDKDGGTTPPPAAKPARPTLLGNLFGK